MSNLNRTKLFLDIALFVVFLITMDPQFTGLAIHEWLSLAVAAPVIVHLLLSWSWVVEMTRRAFGKGLNGARGRYILNWFLFLNGILITLSGVMISEAALPAVGIALPTNSIWLDLHDLSSHLLAVTVGLHIAMHWTWIVTNFKRVFLGGSQQQMSAVAKQEA